MRLGKSCEAEREYWSVDAPPDMPQYDHEEVHANIWARGATAITEEHPINPIRPQCQSRRDSDLYRGQNDRKLQLSRHEGSSHGKTLICFF
jgi:hypothetical protein